MELDLCARLEKETLARPPDIITGHSQPGPRHQIRTSAQKSCRGSGPVYMAQARYLRFSKRTDLLYAWLR